MDRRAKKVDIFSRKSFVIKYLQKKSVYFMSTFCLHFKNAQFQTDLDIFRHPPPGRRNTPLRPAETRPYPTLPAATLTALDRRPVHHRLRHQRPAV